MVSPSEVGGHHESSDGQIPSMQTEGVKAIYGGVSNSHTNHNITRIYCNREADKRKQRSSKTEMENAYRGGRDLKLTYKA